jgi:hypothetical protein
MYGLFKLLAVESGGEKTVLHRQQEQSQITP